MIIASISTIPGRAESLITVLEALNNQSLKPDFLFISVSKYYPRSKKLYPQEHFEGLKTFLSTYSIQNKLIVYENDIGPLLKLITPLRFYNFKDDDFIFTLDDDTPLYDRTIESLYQAYMKNKNAVYAFSGTRQDRFLHAELLPENYDYFEIDIVGGYRGVLYPVNLIDKTDLFKWLDLFINSCAKKLTIPMHDDHIFSYYFKYKNIPRRVSNSPFSKHFSYTTIPNEDGIFNDKTTQENIQIIKDTIYDKELNWVIDNPL
jgi:hypothetical protein